MLGRYLKAQLIVLLCGGLVGPIFLIVYFAIGEQWRSIDWMFYVGLLITAVDVLVALAIANYGAKSSAKSAALEQNGVLAIARIIGVHETGTRVNNQPLIKLDLHIEGAGIMPFQSQDRVLANFSRSPNITKRQVVVLVDPATGQYQIDWNRSNLINGLVPAQFTVEQDNRTYDLTGQAGPLMEILQILKAHHIALDRMVDVRANPVARQQLQAVVRRYAAGAQPPAGAPPMAPTGSPSLLKQPEQSIAQRLQELDRLRATGVLTDAEYTAKRAQIISQI